MTMKFLTNSDNRGGNVLAQAGTKADPRQSGYNVDPGENEFGRIARKLTQLDGAGTAAISATLDTVSEFQGYAQGACKGLTFSSKGMVTLPGDPSSTAMGIVQDRISMGVRIMKKGKVRLVASVVADLDIVEIKLQGPQFPTPISIYDAYDQTFDITKAGEYTLTGSYQLAAKLPNTNFGGRQLAVEMHATLSPA
jgi:hypothetical protein